MEKKNVIAENANVKCENCNVNVIVAGGKLEVEGGSILPLQIHKSTIPCKRGKDVTARIKALLSGDEEALKYISSIIGEINDTGYIEVEGIVRRWVPSQCLAMIYNGKRSFHKILTDMGFDYSWKVLIRDLKQQAKLWRKSDEDGYVDRNRWYNKTTAYAMSQDFLEQLVKTCNTMPRHKCRGKAYINMRCRGINSQKGLFESELSDFCNSFLVASGKIYKAKTPVELLKACEAFFRKTKVFSNWSAKQAPAFTNAYKAAGAYYTMKDLILFENCRMITNDSPIKFCPDSETSLEEMERHFDDIVKNHTVIECGYRMLGLLKAFLDANKFDFKAVKAGWAKRYEK